LWFNAPPAATEHTWRAERETVSLTSALIADLGLCVPQSRNIVASIRKPWRSHDTGNPSLLVESRQSACRLRLLRARWRAPCSK